MVEILAHAKINLFLHIKGKRDDGFHEIETLMVRVALADRITVRMADSPDVRMTCSDASLPCDENNLVVRAAGVFKRTTGWNAGLQIHLEKIIPHGAGLGGGSSDAASVLRACNELSGLAVPDAELSCMAAALGSDVPFFLGTDAALCTGRGEQITPVAAPEPMRILLVKPPFGVPTPWAYQAWSRMQAGTAVATSRGRFDWGELINDMEAPVFAKYVQLRILRDWLAKRCVAAMLAGSGSTVFAICDESADMDSMREEIAREFGETFLSFITTTLAGGSGQ